MDLVRRILSFSFLGFESLVDADASGSFLLPRVCYTCVLDRGCGGGGDHLLLLLLPDLIGSIPARVRRRVGDYRRSGGGAGGTADCSRGCGDILRRRFSVVGGGSSAITEATGLPAEVFHVVRVPLAVPQGGPAGTPGVGVHTQLAQATRLATVYVHPKAVLLTLVMFGPELTVLVPVLTRRGVITSEAGPPAVGLHPEGVLLALIVDGPVLALLVLVRALIKFVLHRHLGDEVSLQHQRHLVLQRNEGVRRVLLPVVDPCGGRRVGGLSCLVHSQVGVLMAR